MSRKQGKGSKPGKPGKDKKDKVRTYFDSKSGGREGYKKGKLVGKQNKLDANKDGKISKADFALLKKKKKNKKTKKSA